MKRHYQKPMDGQCLRYAVASLFGVSVSKVPPTMPDTHKWDAKQKKFVGKGYDMHDQMNVLNKWLGRYGIHVEYSGLYNFGMGYGLPRVPEALTVASGMSPRFEGGHAVVWDGRTSARDHERIFGRVAHDPAKDPATNGKLKNLEGFYIFSIIDPSKLHKLGELYPKRKRKN